MALRTQNFSYPVQRKHFKFEVEQGWVEKNVRF